MTYKSKYQVSKHSHYLVTGVDAKGRRFKSKRCTFLPQARAYNIYKGTIWAVDVNGNKSQLYTVFN